MIAARLHHSNPRNIPAQWPAEVREGVTSLPPGFDLLFASAAEYNDYLSQHQAAYDAWALTYRTPEEIAAAARKTWPSAAQFWAEFTDAEKLAMTDSVIPGIKLLVEELRMWRGEVWSDDPKVQQGLGGLVATGILTPERQSSILTR